jgi:dihydropteroate synthase
MANLPGLAGSPPLDRCLVMGVVNVTPDSFSDGGRWFGADAAVAHGLELIAQGADVIDVGGESTRPGAQRVGADEELRRVKPVITELVRAGAVVSVDTMRAPVAEWALEAGVSLVNDVSGGLADPYMPRLVAKAGVPYVVMHWRGHSHDMYSRARYADVVREVHDELAQRVRAVIAEGVDPSLIVLDPGLGFSKNPAPSGPDAHNWQLLAGLRGLAVIDGQDFPVLVGASRKRYLSRLFDKEGSYPPGERPPVLPEGPPDGRAPSYRTGSPRSFLDNDAATAAITALAAAGGAWCVRVHQVPANADAVRVAAAYRLALDGLAADRSGGRA